MPLCPTPLIYLQCWFLSLSPCLHSHHIHTVNILFPLKKNPKNCHCSSFSFYVCRCQILILVMVWKVRVFWDDSGNSNNDMFIMLKNATHSLLHTFTPVNSCKPYLFMWVLLKWYFSIIVSTIFWRKSLWLWKFFPNKIHMINKHAQTPSIRHNKAA